MKNPYKSDKFRFVIGLILIIVIYSAYYLLFVDYDSAFNISRRIKHIASFATTIVIYFVGTFHLGKLADSWMSSLWHMVHISGLIILTSLGLYDFLFAEISLSLKSFARSIQELLVSPVLYAGMGLLNTTLKNNSQE